MNVILFPPVIHQLMVLIRIERFVRSLSQIERFSSCALWLFQARSVTCALWLFQARSVTCALWLFQARSVTCALWLFQARSVTCALWLFQARSVMRWWTQNRRRLHCSRNWTSSATSCPRSDSQHLFVCLFACWSVCVLAYMLILVMGMWFLTQLYFLKFFYIHFFFSWRWFLLCHLFVQTGGQTLGLLFCFFCVCFFFNKNVFITSVVGIKKKRSHTQKSHPKWWTHRYSWGTQKKKENGEPQRHSWERRRRRLVNPRDVAREHRRRRRLVNPRDVAREHRRRRLVNPRDTAGEHRRRRRNC